MTREAKPELETWQAHDSMARGGCYRTQLLVLTGPDCSERHSGSGDPDGSLGAVVLELFFDPPDHVRLPINDDEIIDRTLAVQALADREVTLLTFDTGQSCGGVPPG